MSTQFKEPIAIIGTGCRFPGETNSPAKLWKLLQEPRDLLCEIPPDRFNAKGFHHPDALHHGNSNARHAYLLSEDHRHFDARFFGIKGVEANAIDPQQRLLLETVYEGIESAGFRMDHLRNSNTAVYVGLMCGDYEAMLLRDFDTMPTYHATGIARSIMANRISYFFDWHGPSMTIDTACSSSLVAVHLAVQSLRAGEARLAVAAGSNLILGPENYIAESKLKMLSPTGRSRMWDKDADGYARGEGIAAVVLKTLSAALEDGDHIECLIRETGVNQDGRTRGITMPSATAQTSLIRDTYARAGLDASRPTDRCQYFEAHGTGTPTGDPLEAEAITSAFFPDKSDFKASDDDVLYIGSIKTVIGHTEGTAGLAGVLKASLALQNRVIPPNMLFNQLNSSIIPFYGNLKILTKHQHWPAVPSGQPRRASVNSFGFGGTNAHAILESYEPAESQVSQASAPCFAPFAFSASTDTSLEAQLKAYSEYFATNPSVNLQDLSFTLNSRRILFSTKAAFAARTPEALNIQIQRRLDSTQGSDGEEVGVRSSSSEAPATLGIFTGQGAQYAGMAADLILNSDFASKCIDKLEESLSELAPSDRPQWSLKNELLADASSSRVTEAALSQPLSTAIQILLVDILYEAGIRFKAVVGHSSGEIGAAYAAGFISAHDAIRIAYYRGLHSHLATGKDGVKGAMIAVATSREDAQELCEMDEFEGRISIAAVNSAASVTLSGDEDAIAEAKIIFNDEKKKATILKVDKAYHSRHMVPCSDAYMKSMQTCSIELQNFTNEGCSWYSSVYNQEITSPFPQLKGSYWNENLVRPVLFSQALTTALEQNPSVEAVIEVGPHPALKGPANMNIQDVLARDIPYTGLLHRGESSITALADGFGYLWTRLGERAVDLPSFASVMEGRVKGKLIKNLPAYQWDHDRSYWHESRISRAIRRRQDPVHELLGSKCPDSTAVHMSWRNLLRMREVPWIQGHALQDQTVFPAAGYIATAIEASRHLAASTNAKLIEIQDFVIHQPLVFNDEDLGVETLFSFVNISMDETDGATSALFTYHSAPGPESDSLTLMASGRLYLLVGIPSMAELPAKAPREPNMVKVETDRFYASLAELGYGYTGPFRALSCLERKLGKASGLVTNPKVDHTTDPLMIHPAMLDAAIQAVILAYCYPNDGQLWSLHLPTSISRIRINPHLGALIAGQGLDLMFDSAIIEGSRAGIFGNVNIYTPHLENALLQVEGMRAVPFTGATSENDINVFSSMTWGPASLCGEAAVSPYRASSEEYDLACLLERVATFYLRLLDQTTPESHPARTTGAYVGYFNYATHVISQVSAGGHPYAKKEWMSDTLEHILSASKAFPDSPDLKIMHIVGREMPRVIRGETTILEHLLPDGLLDNYYSNALGFPQFTMWLSRMTAQLTHRYPHMNVLEIGAGTGGATKGIFKECNQWFSSYTFTDISNGFFEHAQDIFKDHADRMTFKVLDIEKDTRSQGFQDHYYDLIVASFVLHATAKLEHTMRNVRRLLKPGGYVLMAEVTNNDQIRGGFIFGALPGWWLGADDGRVLSPCVSPAQWDDILRRTGFSGADAITPELDRFPYPGSIIASQAVDSQVNFLRRPLSAPYPQDLGRRELERLLIIGGASLKSRVLVEELLEILRSSYPQIDRIATVAEITSQHLSSSTTILSLAEIDKPVFKDIKPQDFEGLKQLFSRDCTMMWITQGRRAQVPESNMIYGFARSQQWEVPGLNLQFIDLESPSTRGSHIIAESLIRFSQLVSWEKAGRLENLLWSLEPEMVLKNDQFHIPRLVPVNEANDRLNSAKRRIISRVSVQDADIRLDDQRCLQLIKAGIPASSLAAGVDCINIEVIFSTRSSIKTLAGRGYFVVGQISNGNSIVLAMTESLASRIRVPVTQVVRCSSASSDVSQLLSLFFHRLLSGYLLSRVQPGETLLVHEPGAFLSSSLRKMAEDRDIRLVYTSVNVEDHPSSLVIHPYATDHEVKRMMPDNVSLFVNLSADRQAAALGIRIASLLPSSCEMEHSSTLFSHEVRSFPSVRSDFVQETLNEAYHKIVESAATLYFHPSVEAIDVTELSSDHNSHVPLQQIRWKTSSVFDVDVQPVDSDSLFAQDRTYWLVGLTGGLGLSLCEWMVKHGAKYVVISSRNPKVDKRWNEMVAQAGGVVMIHSCDVTSRDSIHRLYKEIRETFPPIAGVAQGAMVLQDVPTRDMSFHDLDRVLKPKVDGSKYLNELFPQDTLDFFVFFSSMTGVIGNMGQSNYTAANTFMCALARQRREKGLAASVINIGVIIGVGYVTREVSHADQKNLRKGGYMWMSERDFHQIFAEAVLAGRPNSGLDPEISTGLRRIDPDDPYQPIWYNNPIFSKCIQQRQAAISREANNSSGPSIKVRLQAATNQSQILTILQDCFTAQLQTLLGSASDDAASRSAVLDSRTDELGIDSLIAVEMRSWFMKNLNVNIPVLKILSGITVRELLQYALKEIPQEFIPNAVQNHGDIVTASDPMTPIDAVASQLDASDPNLPSSKESLVDHGSETGASCIRGDSTLDPSITEDESEDEAKHNLFKPLPQKQLPISFSQSMFWFITVLLQDKTTLNHFGCSRLSGCLRVFDLERAVDVVAQRHEALRTCFFVDENQQPMQGILNLPVLHLEQKWIEDDAEIQKESSNLKRHIYDLSSGETMRIVLLSKSAYEHYLLIGCHHINVDGISHQVLMSDLLKAYNHEPLHSPVLQYPDYSVQQHERHRNGGWQPELAYWREELEGFTSVLPILSPSIVTSRRPLTEYVVHRIDARINPASALRIKDTCKRCRATPFHFYLTVFKNLLFCFSNAEDLCIGFGDANRPESNMLESIGPFVNLLPMRFRLKELQSFQDALQETRSKTYGALSNSQVPFEVLLNEFDIPRSAAHSPLFQAFIDYRQGAREKMSFGECQLEMTEFQAGRTAYDLSLDIIDDAAGQPLLMFMAQASLYSRQATEIFAQSYVNLVEAFAKEPELAFDQPPLYNVLDTALTIEYGRGPLHESSWPETLSHRIEMTIEQFGDKIAIKDIDRQGVTYKEMSHRINKIALALTEAGLTQDSVVGVFQEPSSDWVCSFLAILKIGAVYLPLDLGTPLIRLAVMVGDGQVRAVLVHGATKDQVTALGVREAIIINVSGPLPSPQAPIPVLAKAGSPAVILYTSGSTGAPKGVLLSHSSFVNEVEASTNMYKLGSNVVVLQQSALGFDMSVLQMFLALTLGGTLCLSSRSARGDPIIITELIAQERVSFTCATPSEYVSWVTYGNKESLKRSAWEVALSGGEAMPKLLLQKFDSIGKSNLRLYNGYGPTETTCCSTKTKIDYGNPQVLESSISVGFPSPNESIYIVDNKMRLVPVGVPGEIVISGVGVAIGYLGDEELTKRHFVPNIFAPTEYVRNGWTTMYRTGDKGRWNQDGSMSVEGRLAGDTQIKLRGLRVELREIEDAILQASHGALSACVVSTRFDGPDQPEFLIAHVVFSPGYTSSQRELLLRQLPSTLPLPQYMCPALIISLETLPISSSGKVDRRSISSLPIPKDTKAIPDHTALTSLMARLIETWKEVIPGSVFDHQEVGADSDFFHVGGNSILLVRLQALIQEQFQVSIPLAQLFTVPTLRRMAQLVEDKTGSPTHNWIDWEAETKPDPALNDQSIFEDASTVATPPKVAVMTGATGFLGPYLLNRLIETTGVEEIHCIALRNSHHRNAISHDPRVVVHEGDLTLPLLGLSEVAAKTLFTKADVIIHNGADVSHLKTYQTLRSANLESTKELVRFALARKVPIHYVSTAGVAMFTPRESFGEVSVASTLPPSDGLDGYTASKWASERYLEKVNEQFNLPVWIHRPSSITRSSSLLGQDAMEMELLQNLLKYSRIMKAVPSSDKLVGTLDLVSAENVAKGIIGRAMGAEEVSATAPAAVVYVHQTGDLCLPISDMRAFLETETDAVFDTLGIGEWVERAVALGLHPAVGAAFKRVEDTDGAMVFPTFVKDGEA